MYINCDQHTGDCGRHRIRSRSEQTPARQNPVSEAFPQADVKYHA